MGEVHGAITLKNVAATANAKRTHQPHHCIARPYPHPNPSPEERG